MIEQQLHTAIKSAIHVLFGANEGYLQIQKTRKEFEGDLTLVVFPLLKLSKMGPEQTADSIGKFLVDNESMVNHSTQLRVF